MVANLTFINKKL